MNCLGFHHTRPAFHFFQLGRTATDEVFVIPCSFVDTSWYSVLVLDIERSIECEILIIKRYSMMCIETETSLTFQIPTVATAYKMI